MRELYDPIAGSAVHGEHPAVRRAGTQFHQPVILIASAAHGTATLRGIRGGVLALSARAAAAGGRVWL
jgi:hypothetical protein